MSRTSLLFSLSLIFSVVAISLAATSTKQTIKLPKPHYHQEAADPAWLQSAVQFHGHLGPAIVFGVRTGSAGLDAVQAQGYFDIEVAAQGPFTGPPQSCILDGLQLSTGATLGKHNLKVVVSDDYVFTMKNKKTGKTAEIRPTPELLKLMWSRLEADDHDQGDAHDEMHRVETIARQIADMPQDEIMVIKMIP